MCIKIKKIIYIHYTVYIKKQNYIKILFLFSSSLNITELPEEKEELDRGTGEEFDGETEKEKDEENTTYIPRRIRSKQDELAVILGIELTRNAEQKKLIEKIQAQNETILNRKITEDDDIDLFFKSLAKTVKKLPSKVINEVKLKTLALVSETEEKYAALQYQATNNVTAQGFFNQPNENTINFQISSSNTSTSIYNTSESSQGFIT